MIPALSLLACTTGTEPGAAAPTAEGVACLAVEGAELPTGDRDLGVEVDGTPFAETEPAGQDWQWGVRCDQATRVLSLQDGDGALWHVAWGWGEGGFDRTLPTVLGPEDPVHLVFRWVDDVNDAAGFAISDEADRIIAAVEIGLWGPALEPGDVPDLTVRDGLVTGTEVVDCGTKEARQLLFDGGFDEVTLEAVDRAPLNVGGEETEVWALASFGWRDATCDDTEGERSWAVFR